VNSNNSILALTPDDRNAPKRLQTGWPDPPAPEAFYGLAGRIVSAIDPHTESDPVAILIQFLIAFGNLIRRTAHFIVDGKDHFTNLFAVLVGETAISRKGTSWSQVERLMAKVDEGWKKHCVKTGLSSGEGLIAVVSDQLVRKKKKHQQEPDSNPLSHLLDVSDEEEPPEKRVLIIEPEFDSVLQVNRRQGNTISAVLRQAWDGGNLSTLTKEKLEAHDVHVSVVGHITRDELRRDLDSVNYANGFGNRFMWICVERSKSLPHGGHFHLEDSSGLVNEIKQCRDFVLNDYMLWGEPITIDREARKLWESVYDGLTAGNPPGLLGAMVARAAPIVLRLACLYTLLEQEVEIRTPHLRAALALWKYCEDSAGYIFGNALGDPMADVILNRLQAAPNGLSRTAISQLFNRNKDASEIGRALHTLEESGKARMETKEEGPGRPTEVWFAR